MLLTKWVLSLFSTTCPLWDQTPDSVGRAAFQQCLIEHQYLNSGTYFGKYHEISQCLREEYDIHCSVRDVRLFEEQQRKLGRTRSAFRNKKNPVVSND